MLLRVADAADDDTDFTMTHRSRIHAARTGGHRAALTVARAARSVDGIRRFSIDGAVRSRAVDGGIDLNVDRTTIQISVDFELPAHLEAATGEQ